MYNKLPTPKPSVTQAGWQGPDTLTLLPDSEGRYGFSLRYFVIHPPGSTSPTKGFHRDSYWLDHGFNALDIETSLANERQTQPVDIFYAKNIKEGGPAHKAGLRSGDRVVSVNGQLIGGKSYSEVIESIEYCTGELKLGILPHNEDILQSAYEEYIYDDKPLTRKERSNSSNSIKMFQQASVNKWSVPITTHKRNSRESISSETLNEDKKYEPCVQFFGGTPIVNIENKSSRSNSISSSGSATPLNRTSGKTSPARRTSQRFDPCVSFVAGKPVTPEAASVDDEAQNTSVHAQKIQSALRKEANKKGYPIGTRLAPKMIEGVSKPGAVSSIAGKFATGHVDGPAEPSRRASVTSCLRDDFQSIPRPYQRNMSVSSDMEREGKENRMPGKDISPENKTRNTRNPLSSLTSQATLVQNKLKSDAHPPTGKHSHVTNSLKGQPPRKRNMISNGRKLSVSSSVENSDEESHIESDDENALNNWHGRRTSYLQATAMKVRTGGAGGRHLENREADDEDSDSTFGTKTLTPQKSLDEFEVNAVIKEGPLNRKLERSLDRKKPSQRQWKPIYGVLKGHRLFCYKADGNEADDEIIQPIPIRSSIIEIASDYSKRRHVFRLMTSHGNEYLFQAEDTSSMMSWVHTLREHNPDKESLAKTTASLRQEKNDHTTSSLAHSPPTKSSSFKDKKTGISIRKPGFGLRSSGRKSRIKEKEAAVVESVGKTLQNSSPARYAKNVPFIVEHCCTVIEERGKYVVGIYRISGNASTCKSLEMELDTKDIDDIDWGDEKWYEIHNIGSLLKSYLRKLEEPVIPTHLYPKFIQCNRFPDPTDRLKSFRQLVKSLPDYHFETLQYLIRHLRVIAEHSDENKMEPNNLAIVFGPTVVRTKEQSTQSMVEDMADQCKIIETLLKQYDWVFGESSEEPINVEKGDEVISAHASESLIKCFQNQTSQEMPNSTMDVSQNNNNKKGNKFSTLKSNLSMKLRNGNSGKNTSPKPENRFKSRSVNEEESDYDYSSTSPPTRQKNFKSNEIHAEIPAGVNTIRVVNDSNGVNIGQFSKNININIKFDPNHRTPDYSPELSHRTNGSPKLSDLSEKTLSRLNRITNSMKIDESKYHSKDDGVDSGVTSPLRLDSDDNMSITSDSATSSRKESLDSLSAPSPRNIRRVQPVYRQQSSGGSAASSNDERSPTLPKSSFPGQNYPPVMEERTNFQRQESVRSSVRGTADTRGPNANPNDKKTVTKRSDVKRRNLPVSPRSSKRELYSIMPGDGNDFDEKIKALIDPSYDKALNEKALSEMFQPARSKQTNPAPWPGESATNADWWLSGGSNNKKQVAPKDKAEAVSIIAGVIETQKRLKFTPASPNKNNTINEFKFPVTNPTKPTEPVINKHEFLSPNTRRKVPPKTESNPLDLSARFDTLKQKEESHHKKIDTILSASGKAPFTSHLSTQNDSMDDSKLNNYLRQVAELIKDEHLLEGLKTITKMTEQKISEGVAGRRLKSESSYLDAALQNRHQVLERSKSANMPSSTREFKNRTSPLLDETYSGYNYSKLYPS